MAGFQGIGRDITSELAAQKEMARYTQCLEFLYNKSQAFLESSSYADIFRNISTGVHDLVPSRAEVEKASGGGVVVVVVVVVVLGLVVVGAGIIAAVAIPSLLGARVAANEASALGDLRSVISAQAVYASSSGGVYGSPACLAAPSSCISDYPAGMPLLDASLVIEGTKSGYVRTFHAGPPMSSATGAEGLSSFAVTLVPAEPGKTGVRSFCGDASGLICQDPTGGRFDAEGGASPAGCIPVG